MLRRKWALLIPLQAVVLVVAVYCRKFPNVSTISTDTVHSVGEADSVRDKYTANGQTVSINQNLLNGQQHPPGTDVDPESECVGGRCGSGGDLSGGVRRQEIGDSVVETGHGDGQGLALPVQRKVQAGWSRAVHGSFLDLARWRFREREGRPATKADEDWVFPHLQVLFTSGV